MQQQDPQHPNYWGVGAFGRNYYSAALVGPQNDRQIVQKYGEVTGFSPNSSRFSFLMVSQLLTMLLFLTYAILYIIEIIGPFYIRNWPSFLGWSIIGGVLIVLMQTGGIFMFHRANNVAPVQGEIRGNMPTGNAIISPAHAKELFVGWLSSLIVYAAVFWAQLGWLERFHSAACCSGGVADTSDALDLNTYRSAVLLEIVFCIIGTIFLLRTFFTHMNPLATISQLYSQSKYPGPNPGYSGNGQPYERQQRVF